MAWSKPFGERNYLLHLSSHFRHPMCGIFLGRRKEMKRIVMIVGSLRKESFNRKVAQYIESLIGSRAVIFHIWTRIESILLPLPLKGSGRK